MPNRSNEGPSYKYKWAPIQYCSNRWSCYWLVLPSQMMFVMSKGPSIGTWSLAWSFSKVMFRTLNAFPTLDLEACLFSVAWTSENKQGNKQRRGQGSMTTVGHGEVRVWIDGWTRRVMSQWLRAERKWHRWMEHDLRRVVARVEVPTEGSLRRGKDGLPARKRSPREAFREGS